MNKKIIILVPQTVLIFYLFLLFHNEVDSKKELFPQVNLLINIGNL